MSWLTWVAVVGGLLLFFSIASAYVQRGPISTAALYLLLGIGLGPVGANLLTIDVNLHGEDIERVAAVAVMVALFMGGLRMRLPLRDLAWRPALFLAGPILVVSIVGLAMVIHLVTRLPLAGSLLLAAILSPTDPVLASAVAVEDAADKDGMRFGLSGEAGLNDGAAFPFVVLALDWAAHGAVGPWLGEWALTRIVWAMPAALVLGYAAGRFTGQLAIRLRHRERDVAAPNDFLALALIALSYTAAEAIGAWGFLAVFAAGVGLRAAEVTVVQAAPHPKIAADDSIDNTDHPPAEDLVSATVDEKALAQPAVAAGVVVAEVLSFGDTIERLLEISLVVALGVVVVPHWDVRAVPIAAGLFLVVRPIAVVAMLRWTSVTRLQRWLMGWFGVRGIGSLYYLGYALTHDRVLASNAIVDITISVVALSVLVHGVSGKPLLAWYARRLAADERPERQGALGADRAHSVKS